MQQMGKLRPYHIVLWGGDKKKKKVCRVGPLSGSLPVMRLAVQDFQRFSFPTCKWNESSFS